MRKRGQMTHLRIKKTNYHSSHQQLTFTEYAGLLKLFKTTQLDADVLTEFTTIAL